MIDIRNRAQIQNDYDQNLLDEEVNGQGSGVVYLKNQKSRVKEEIIPEAQIIDLENIANERQDRISAIKQ